MAKVGVRLSINVSEIQKQHMFKGKQGAYLDATVFIDLDQQDQYGNNGMITQSWKDAPKGQTPILGNAKVFWNDQGQQQAPKQQTRPATSQPAQNGYNQPPDDDFDDQIPF